MTTTNELKEMIVKLKMDLLKVQIPKGTCPYTYYTPSNGKKIDCTMDCNECWNKFMKAREEIIKNEIRGL